MLWSYWRVKSDGLRSSIRPTAYTTRYDAAAALGPRQRDRKDLRLVCLMLVVLDGQVVPEFPVQAVGTDWALKCRQSGSRVVIYGEIPDPLWYEDK